MVRRGLAGDHNVRVVSPCEPAHNAAATRRERVKLAPRIALMDEHLPSAGGITPTKRRNPPLAFLLSPFRANRPSDSSPIPQTLRNLVEKAVLNSCILPDFLVFSITFRL